ncbi:S-layer homology domain-containing protein [Ureibacillus manganicus]|uniref:Beta-N-acetylglucosaminidase n=1 Tax=Ureibacillus manganicus DSM 26584 TaxID=1384049 RepID=A0A0A3IZ86_9BACL|nr:S-layer homology domain-containing protein [Ureibacillus manganicus]KGR80132.1 beta-N-acetylglucosaminidase [Ureibacillus manganicus DSM 26584]
MKRRLIAALVVLFAVVQFTAPPASAEDISKHWAYEKMSYLIGNEIMNGDPSGKYRPDDSITRAEFATLLVKVLQLPEVDGVVSFHDVKEGDWYYHSVKRASYYGLVAGDEKGNFNPDSKITRQEMAVMLNNALNYNGVSVSPATLSFIDNNKIASWAYDDVQIVVSFKLINGYPDSTFKPLGNTTRAEASTVLYFYLKPEEKPVDKPIEIGKEYNKVLYNLNFADVVSLQANHSPKEDGGGIFTASAALVEFYLNPNNFKKDTLEYYQFLKLSTPVENLDAAVINEKVLKGQGILENTAASFIQAGIDHNVNAIYLISHALHETGKGVSKLASGIEVGLDASGVAKMVTDENRNDLVDIKTTYNFYGIGAKDADPIKLGSERAYKEGWFTTHDAIVGGAKFVKVDYIDQGQDTLYKMKWDPDQPTNHQYATHVVWAVAQAKYIYDIYKVTNSDETTKVVFEVPEYNFQPASSPMPTKENRYAILPTYSGGIGQLTADNVNVRTYPVVMNSPSNSILKLPLNTQVNIIGNNGNWYRVKTELGQEGWIRNDNVKVLNGLYVIDMNTKLRVRSEPNTSSKILKELPAKSLVIGVFDENKNFVKNGDWYQVLVDGKTGWAHGDYIVPPAK